MIPVGRTKLLRYLYNLQLLARCSRSCTRSQQNATDSSITSHFITNVGTASLSSPSQWNFTHRHIVILNVIACAAFKKAAESLEKLMDVMREELPDTVVVVR